MIYNDYARIFDRWAYLFGTSAGPWGLTISQPTTPKTVTQFFDGTMKPISGELMEIQNEWIVNTGFRNPDGTVNRISTIKEILSDPFGSHDITIVGGPQHYVLNQIPDYTYSIWTEANVIDANGKVTGTFSHSHEWRPATDQLNPFWSAGPATRSCITHHEEWTDDSGGTWSLKIKRTCHSAEGAGSIWLVDDEISAETYGMIYAWGY